MQIKPWFILIKYNTYIKQASNYYSSYYTIKQSWFVARKIRTHKSTKTKTNTKNSKGDWFF